MPPYIFPSLFQFLVFQINSEGKVVWLTPLSVVMPLRLTRGRLFQHLHKYVLWHVDHLLGNDREIRSYTTAVAR
jgi:hypothetical protein